MHQYACWILCAPIHVEWMELFTLTLGIVGFWNLFLQPVVLRKLNFFMRYLIDDVDGVFHYPWPWPAWREIDSHQTCFYHIEEIPLPWQYFEAQWTFFEGLLECKNVLHFKSTIFAPGCRKRWEVGVFVTRCDHIQYQKRTHFSTFYMNYYSWMRNYPNPSLEQ